MIRLRDFILSPSNGWYVAEVWFAGAKYINVGTFVRVIRWVTP